ncbi:MAG: reprolysin-like metallopeptidase [Hyphomicrobiaceae bacterium]
MASNWFDPSNSDSWKIHSSAPGYGCACPSCAAPVALNGTGGESMALAGETPVSFLAFDTDLTDADQNIDALMNTNAGTFSTYWSNLSLTFSFLDEASDISYSPGSGITFAEAFNADQMAATRTVLGQFAGVSNLAFTESTLGDPNGNLRFFEGNGIGTAFAYYPNGAESGGDGWFNTSYYNAPTLGTYAYHTFLHEIGHALGLKHGHETGGPGAMTADKDSMEYSVMTYRSHTGAGLSGYSNDTNSFAQSLMMYDIAAIQRFYGADFTSNSTNTTYTFSTTTGEMFVNGVSQGTPGGNVVFRTVWDGNGVDTYDLSNYTTALNIDLTPGGYSDFSVGANNQRAMLDWGYYGPVTYARGHLFNALQYEGDARSLIENANGGSAADIITGNAANNTLNGNGGNDTLNGGDGNDFLNGGTGNDSMTGGTGNDTFVVDSASDVVVEAAGAGGGTDFVRTWAFNLDLANYANVENALLTGTASLSITGNNGANVLTGNTGNNTLNGNDGNDTLSGGDGNDFLNGGVGVDSMIGGAGNDTFVVDSTSDVVVEAVGAGGGTDLVRTWAFNLDLANYANVENALLTGTSSLSITGNDSANVLTGNTGNNTLNGNGGNDTLNGGDGNDLLSGGSGIDSMIGGAGNDTFIVDSTSDIVVEAAGAGGGTDTVRTWVFNLNLASYANVENALLTGTSSLSLTGNSGANTLTGNAGANTMTGGGGADTFAFNTALGGTNIDTITDFVVVDDTIALENGIMTALGAAGTLTANQFVIGAHAADADDHIIYDDTTGKLYYDDNGSTAGGEVQIATLSSGLLLTHADFLVI